MSPRLKGLTFKKSLQTSVQAIGDVFGGRRIFLGSFKSTGSFLCYLPGLGGNSRRTCLAGLSMSFAKQGERSKISQMKKKKWNLMWYFYSLHSESSLQRPFWRKNEGLCNWFNLFLCSLSIYLNLVGGSVTRWSRTYVTETAAWVQILTPLNIHLIGFF